ncbi:MAG: 50S ribosomal protein L32 [Deltaproteobacteria bacterium]|nr:50S ribosomal protein L32 [Deltaproteobacteria bacterium]MBW2085305.1 50S ribosomal protein L32 [Deltaproteobacteria bacterium]
MAVQKRKMSRSKSRKRRTHYSQKQPTLVHCSQCDELKLPHHVCPNCGTYQGRQIIEVGEG